MKTTDTRPLAQRITQGPASICRVDPGYVEVNGPEYMITSMSHDTRDTDEIDANAELIVEAFNTTHETGKTPRQLADERTELITILKACKGFYGDSTGYYHVSPEAHRAAIELLKRIDP